LATLLILQIVSCAMMTGLIWAIQILHYPAFRYVDEKQFEKFHLFHTKKITWIVLPLMTVELVTGILLVLFFPDQQFWINFFAILMIWARTFFLSVPMHHLLEKGRNERAIDRLVLTNWFRTILWSARLCLLVVVLMKNFEVGNGNFGA